jgi:hypothetical protein
VTPVDGTPGTSEVQTIDLSALTGTNTEFQLQFDNSATDTRSGYTTGLLKKGATPAATAQTIENALNGLPSIADAGGVTVTVNGTDSFDVHFTAHGDQQTISAAVGQHETQTLDVRALEKFHLNTTTKTEGDAAQVINEHQIVDLTGVQTDFTLQFGNNRTVSLPANATVADIENALNALASVKATGPANSGSVSVAPLNNVGTNGTTTLRVEVTFNTAGNVAQITGTADSANGVFRVGVNGHLTQALRVGLVDPNGPDTTQSKIDLADALNALPEIQTLLGHDQGKVAVAYNPATGNYQLDYNSLGDQPDLTAGGTFSVEQTVDLHRITDGTANGAIPLPIFEATKGRTIGPVTTTATQGSTAVIEVQRIDLTNELAYNGGNSAFNVTFNGQPGADLISTTSPTLAGDLATAYTNLVGSAVAVQDLGNNVFELTFSVSGDQPAAGTVDTNNGPVTTSGEFTKGAPSIRELQKLDLNNLPAGSSTFQVQFGGMVGTVNLTGANQAENAALIDAALDALPTGGVTVTSNNDATANSFGTFNVRFDNDGNVAQIAATSFVTTQAVQGGATNEVQHIDVSALQSSANAGSTFDLAYNGEVTTPLSRFATATDVKNALNALPQFAGANNVTVTGSNGNFDVTFADTVDHAGLIFAQAGNEEIQHIDTTNLQAQGSPNFKLTFMSQVTGAIPTGASGNFVSNELNQLPTVVTAGGVTVTETLDAQFNVVGYDVQFNTFVDQSAITGSVAVHEQLILDLHNLQNEPGFLTFSTGPGNTSFPVPTSASEFFIQQAINSLGGQNAIVTQLHPGVFSISYQNPGSPAPLLAFVNKEGNSVRVPVNASATEVESALDNVSVSDVMLAGANGFFAISYADTGDQIDLTGAANNHEQLRPDLFAGQGSFHIVIGSEQTVELAAHATADQIRLALNNLSAVQDLGGVRSVVVNPDSSILVTFAGDYELPAFQFVARQNLIADNMKEITPGDANNRDVQTFSYTLQGAFDAAKFANARLVGAIADFNEIDSNRFHFFDLTNNGLAHLDPNGVPVDGTNVPLLPTVATPGNPFMEGDLPIDGIVMAKVIDANTTNFIPEAALIGNPDKTVGGTLFFDYLNNR